MLPNNLKYTKEHEWIKKEGDYIVVGITNYAQGELGDIVFVELPEIGESFNEGDTIGTIEAVKTVADIYCPLSGQIVEVNSSIEDSPELVNNSPYDKGWLVKMKVKEGVSNSHLLSSEDYEKIIL